MDRRGLPIAGVMLLLVAISGCGWFGESEDDLFDDDFLELGAASELEEPVQEVDGSSEDASFALQVRKGDRFPLAKTVEDRLTQQTGQRTVTSRSKLELFLAITVEEIRDGETRMGVEYQRVRYEQDLAGQRVEYDSARPRGPVPPEMQVYQGLIGNRFSFWVDSNHRLIELVGFDEFLQRCVGHVPHERQREMLARLGGASREEGVANFIDESLGLLASATDGRNEGQDMGAGYTWTMPRQIDQPLPMSLTTQYTLKQLDDQVAEIDVVETIVPVTSSGGRGRHDRDVEVKVEGGRSFGSYTIDRQTGLPISSRVERHLDMVVQLADGNAFPQRKQTVTTVRAFPEQEELERGARSAERGTGGRELGARNSERGVRSGRERERDSERGAFEFGTRNAERGAWGRERGAAGRREGL